MKCFGIGTAQIWHVIKTTAVGALTLSDGASAAGLAPRRGLRQVTGSDAATVALIVGTASQRCVNDGNAPEMPAVLWPCSPGDAHGLWLSTPDGQLVSAAAPDHCLDVFDWRYESNAAVGTWPCNGGDNQRWDTTTAQAAAAPIHPLQRPDLCLSPANGATGTLTRLVLSPCTPDGSTWRIKKIAGTTDSQPPAPPTDLTAFDLSCSKVSLSWEAPEDDTAVAAYDIYHDGQLVQSVDGSVRRAEVDVLPGASWGFFVSARDAAGNVSPASSTVDVEAPVCVTDGSPPSQPQTLRGDAIGNSVSLTWESPSGEQAVSAYLIYRDNQLIAELPRQSSADTSHAFLDSGLQVSHTYLYEVAARNASGNLSLRSDPASVTTADTCADAVCGVQQVAANADLFWGLVHLPDGTLLASLRDAQRIVQVDPTDGSTRLLGTVPNVQGTDGEGGLLGLAILPNFAAERWLYIYHTSPTDNRIVRLRLAQDLTLQPESLQVLLQGIPRNKYHNGGRLRTDPHSAPDYTLFASTGDALNTAAAQDRNSLSGKILRIFANGSVPADNPWGTPVWALGLRNPQGLTFDATGNLYSQEFGNSAMDEANWIRRGGNYGWPACEGNVSHNGQGCATPGFLPPLWTIPTSEGSCSGLAAIKDALWVGCQRGQSLYRLGLELTAQGPAVRSVRRYFAGMFGRIRTVEPTLDGNLDFTTTNGVGPQARDSNTGSDKDNIPNNSDSRIYRVTLKRA